MESVRELYGYLSYLISERSKKKIMYIVIPNFLVATLDVVAISLVGFLVSNGIGLASGNREITSEIPFIHLKSNNSEVFFVTLSAACVLLFLSRSAASIFINRMALRFFARKSLDSSLNLTKRFFENHGTIKTKLNSHQIVHALTSGVDSIILGCLGSLAMLISELAIVFFIAISVIFISPLLGILSLVFLSCYFVVANQIIGSRIRTLGSEQTRLQMNYVQTLMESIFLFPELRLANKVSSYLDAAKSNRRNFLEIGAAANFLPNLSKHLLEMTIIVLAAGIFGFQAYTGELSSAITTFAVFLAASSRIVPSLVRAQNSYFAFRQNFGNSSVTRQLMDELQESRDFDYSNTKKLVKTKEFCPVVEINNVSFGFETTGSEVLKNVSLSIHAGEFLAIVGDSGAGKSTLLDLILGIREPTSGTIEISGESPREAIKTWPGAISFVPQKTFILNGTVAENITLKKNPVLETSEELLKLLESAKLDKIIEDKKSILSYFVGENGSNLSGGERQRMGIARALFTRPKLLILDEATSSLDAITEDLVTRELYQKRHNQTLVVVAHKLSTIRNADKVAFLEKGELVAFGSFDQVRAKVPKFDQQAKLLSL